MQHYFTIMRKTYISFWNEIQLSIAREMWIIQHHLFITIFNHKYDFVLTRDKCVRPENLEKDGNYHMDIIVIHWTVALIG